jgi:hypothetical protein
MTTSKLKQSIRYQKAHQRLCKEVLPDCPKMRRLLALDSKRDGLSRFNDHIWKTMYQDGFRPRIDNQNPKFSGQFEQILANQVEMERVSKSIERLEKKGFLLEDAKKIRYQLNVGRLSQSFS